MQNINPHFVVGIGGSAGGLKAYTALLSVLAPDTQMAFVIIPHLSPDHKSLLTNLLAKSTSMPVFEANDGMEIKANHVYVAPPNANLFMKNLTFKIISPRTLLNGQHHQVDLFLQSLAEAMGARAIGIILSGGDGDGTQGCQMIKSKGGITFTQDLSAQVDSMPLSAQASGCVDYVLAPADIARKLKKISLNFLP